LKLRPLEGHLEQSLEHPQRQPRGLRELCDLNPIAFAGIAHGERHRLVAQRILGRLTSMSGDPEWFAT
jgi:hypothetical protein